MCSASRGPRNGEKKPRRPAAQGGERPHLCLRDTWAGRASLSRSLSENQPWRLPRLLPRSLLETLPRVGSTRCVATGNLLTASFRVCKRELLAIRLSQDCCGGPSVHSRGGPGTAPGVGSFTRGLSLRHSVMGSRERHQQRRCSKTISQAPSPPAVLVFIERRC